MMKNKILKFIEAVSSLKWLLKRKRKETEIFAKKNTLNDAKIEMMEREKVLHTIETIYRIEQKICHDQLIKATGEGISKNIETNLEEATKALGDIIKILNKTDFKRYNQLHGYSTNYPSKRIKRRIATPWD